MTSAFCPVFLRWIYSGKLLKPIVWWRNWREVRWGKPLKLTPLEMEELKRFTPVLRERPREVAEQVREVGARARRMLEAMDSEKMVDSIPAVLSKSALDDMQAFMNALVKVKRRAEDLEGQLTHDVEDMMRRIADEIDSLRVEKEAAPTGGDGGE
ncbi:MAG TPA: hypothetical protein VFI25_02290 [Planctomycetota bacterium]|jgi:hypothetical protein|nr:hypothetical protein [Planctomycetota bacterium]